MDVECWRLHLSPLLENTVMELKIIQDKAWTYHGSFKQNKWQRVKSNIISHVKVELFACKKNSQDAKYKCYELL